MKRLTIFTILLFAVMTLFMQGCQSQQENEEAAQREKMKKWGKDFTPDKYMEGKGKPKKPYWEK
jgi:preprotein translocase subunit SecG